MSEAVLVDTWLSQAEEALQAEKWPEASKHCKKPKLLHPTTLRFYLFWAPVSCIWDDQRSPRNFRSLVKRQPDSAEAYNNLGVALLMDGDPHGARFAFEQALALDPTNEIAQKHLALSCLQSGDFAGAAHILESLITTSEDIELRLWLGHCYAGLGKPHLARELYQQVLQRHPDHPQAQEALHALDRTKEPEPSKRRAAPASNPTLRNILFCGSGEVSDFRLNLPARWLKRIGFNTRFVLYPQPQDIESADVVVFLRLIFTARACKPWPSVCAKAKPSS